MLLWVFTRHQYGISAVVSQTSFCVETSGAIAKCGLFSQALFYCSQFVCLFVFFLQSLDQNSKQQSVVTPADIYSQFTPKQELKSILRKPSGEGKKKQASKDKVALTEEVQAGITKEKTEKDFDLQKVIC